MDERKPQPTRNSSQTVAKVAIAVLVVIAIAGIVLATLRRPNAAADAPAAADATQPASSAMTPPGAASTAAAAATADTEAGPNQVAFAPGSAELSEPATSKLLKLAETAVKQKRNVVITARFEGSRPDTDKLRTLAMSRAAAVRSVLEQNKVLLTRMTVNAQSKALGEASASELNRVAVELN